MFSTLTEIIRVQSRPEKQTGNLGRFYSVSFVCGSQEISVGVISMYSEKILMMKLHRSYTEQFHLVSQPNCCHGLMRVFHAETALRPRTTLVFSYMPRKIL